MNTHSAFPRQSLTPWSRTCGETRWRHFIQVDLTAAITNPSNGKAHTGAATKNGSKSNEGEILDALAKDIYGVAREALKRIRICL